MKTGNASAPHRSVMIRFTLPFSGRHQAPKQYAAGLDGEAPFPGLFQKKRGRALSTPSALSFGMHAADPCREQSRKQGYLPSSRVYCI